MTIEIDQLPREAEQLPDLTAVEREVLGLLRQGLTSREIAERLTVSETAIYVLIADLLDAIEFAAPTVSAADIHAAGGTRPATADEVAAFQDQFGPFERDGEG